MSVEAIAGLKDAVLERVRKVIVGQEEVVHLLLAALLSDGHVLLEGVPGTGKTLLARVFSASLSLQFKRIQFTPDMMPGDIIGSNLFDFKTSAFSFIQGPVFTDFLLADEINRTPPKTQSALLEAMQERSITVDGKTQPLSRTFMVVATQNPIEQEGTYPLPEAQLDRFLFKINVRYPGRDQECEMVRIHGHKTSSPRLEEFDISPVCGPEEIGRLRQVVAGVRLAEEMVGYIVDLVRATREHPSFQVGASPRTSNMLASAARALAVLSGRDFVIPDDVKALWRPALRHRILISPGMELEGVAADEVLGQVLDRVPAPR
jgi:MoxR-like ATPase